MVGFFYSEFDNLVDAATSEYLPGAQPDLAKNLEICDLIKSRQVNSREAMRTIKRRLQHRNPNVQLLALELADSALKNTLPQFRRELASREFVDVIVSLCRMNVDDGVGIAESTVVASMAQEKFSSWVRLVGDEPGLTYLREAFEQAQREGVNFPPASNFFASAPSVTAIPNLNYSSTTAYLPSSAIVQTDAPPEWTDSTICQRCNVTFSLLLRKHHCRRCGRTFCQDCSAKTIALPEMGFGEEAVRVCESCYARKQAERSSRRVSSSSETARPADTSNLTNKFEEDLARAIQLSLQESQPSASIATGKTDPATAAYDEEAALAAAIAESLRQGPSSPLRSEPVPPPTITTNATIPLMGRGLLNPIERENIQLFSELVHRMSPRDEELEEADFVRLAQDMNHLRARLHQTISTADNSDADPMTLDGRRILGILQAALEHYEQLVLRSNGNDASNRPKTSIDHAITEHENHEMDLTRVPTQPHSETGSIVRISALTVADDSDANEEEDVDSAKVKLNLQPISVDVVPALQPQRLQSEMMKQPVLVSLSDTDEQEGDKPSKEDNPLQDILINDQPLIDL